MDFSKYSQIPAEPATAKEIGLAAATLSAMARRGLVEVIPGKPNKYRRIDNPAIKVYMLCEQYKGDYDTYFTLRKEGESLGMLCSMKGNDVLDCWGNKYDLTGVNKIEFRTRSFDI